MNGDQHYCIDLSELPTSASSSFHRAHKNIDGLVYYASNDVSLVDLSTLLGKIHTHKKSFYTLQWWGCSYLAFPQPENLGDEQKELIYKFLLAIDMPLAVIKSSDLSVQQFLFMITTHCAKRRFTFERDKTISMDNRFIQYHKHKGYCENTRYTNAESIISMNEEPTRATTSSSHTSELGTVGSTFSIDQFVEDVPHQVETMYHKPHSHMIGNSASAKRCPDVQCVLL